MAQLPTGTVTFLFTDIAGSTRLLQQLGNRYAEALAEHAWPEGTSLHVRMGLHTGTPQLVGDHYVGLDVHRAARIAAAAHGGQVLLSADTEALVENQLPQG